MYRHKNELSLRKVERDDLDDLLALKQESWFGTHRIAIINKANQEQWFEHMTVSSTDCIMIAAHEGKRIGVFKINNIDWMNRVCSIGHDIFSEHRGKGLGYKIVEAGVDFCFEILNMNRLDAEVLKNNVVSQKTLLKGGFEIEGCRKQAVFKCNQYIDSLFCGVIRSDWEALPRVQAFGGLCNLSYTPLDKPR